MSKFIKIDIRNQDKQKYTNTQKTLTCNSYWWVCHDKGTKLYICGGRGYSKYKGYIPNQELDTVWYTKVQPPCPYPSKEFRNNSDSDVRQNSG